MSCYVCRFYSSTVHCTQGNNRSLPVTARSLETLIRLSSAHAKARLSQKVEEADAAEALDLMSFALYHETNASLDEQNDGVEHNNPHSHKSKSRSRSQEEQGAGEGDGNLDSSSTRAEVRTSLQTQHRQYLNKFCGLRCSHAGTKHDRLRYLFKLICDSLLLVDKSHS